jgi:hypothetical protein
MFTMYDSVTIDEIPAAPHAVAAYINGKYANADAARERFPHARILTISVEGDVAADCYDIENGDYNPADAPRLLKIAQDAGIWRPCFYADLSNMPAVKIALKGTVRTDIRLWVAAYAGTSLSDAAGLLAQGYDAHQFETNALGRNLDESLCDSDFFRPITKTEAVPVAEPAKPAHTVNIDVDGQKVGSVHVQFDTETNTWKTTQ